VLKKFFQLISTLVSHSRRDEYWTEREREDDEEDDDEDEECVSKNEIMNNEISSSLSS